MIRDEIEEVKERLKNSYSPYSNFCVASMVKTKEGKKYFGVNIDPNNKLMGSYMSIEEIRKAIGATTLDYLSLKNLKKILNGGDDFYTGCFKEDEE